MMYPIVVQILKDAIDCATALETIPLRDEANYAKDEYSSRHINH